MSDVDAQECRRIAVGIIDRVARSAADPRKCGTFSRRDRDALVLLRTIMDFDMATGRPPVVEHPWLPVVDHILRLI